jgi:hypothetical protein
MRRNSINKIAVTKLRQTLYSILLFVKLKNKINLDHIQLKSASILSELTKKSINTSKALFATKLYIKYKKIVNVIPKKLLQIKKRLVAVVVSNGI